MDNDDAFFVTLRAAELVLNDKYLKAVEDNDVKEMDIVNIRLETLEIIEQVFYEVIKLRGDQTND
jgi:hypothetical protein